MDKITSFTIDHLKLLPGVYVSRKDRVDDQVITTFDIRMTRPNYEPVMNTAEVHTIEHLAATWLRNNEEWKDRVPAPPDLTNNPRHGLPQIPVIFLASNLCFFYNLDHTFCLSV